MVMQSLLAVFDAMKLVKFHRELVAGVLLVMALLVFQHKDVRAVRGEWTQQQHARC